MRAPAATYNAAPAAASSAADAAPAARAKSAAGTGQLEMRATSPLQEELERIAKLRAQGNDADADLALEAFARKYPDYRIPDAMWERVKAR
jgi:hypothetical protein